MARIDIIQMLYRKEKSPLDFSFENLKSRPLLSMITPQDIYELNKIATSIKLSSKPQEKYKRIDSILLPRGFKRIASGTNRIAYKFLDDNQICIKVALDKIGLKDNPREFQNQFLLQPFVTKVFEVSPCGTVGLFERVNPITSREEYCTVADDIFNLLTMLIGKYVLEDIGTRYFQNIGIRYGFGPVLLDFPYVYELDGNKLFCNKMDPYTGIICGGEIDYDEGFNKLVCTKCGKQYYAKQLEKYKKERQITIKEEGEHDMSIVIKRNNKIIDRIESEKNVDVIPTYEQPKIKIVNPNIKEKGKNIDSQSSVDRSDEKSVNQQQPNTRTSSNDYLGNVDKSIYQHSESEGIDTIPPMEVDSIEFVPGEEDENNKNTDVVDAY